jgi:SAM-dependent methyltransferase
VDNHQPYLDELERRAREQGLADLIETRCADMSSLDLGGETFDLVWAEGSIFIVGVTEGLQAWRGFLKPGGALGFTELTWFEEDVPDECREFFAVEYPPMADTASHLATIDACGYDLAGRFRLSESSWWDPFYDHVAARMAGYVPPDDEPETRAVVNMVRNETEMYRRFSRWYGYEFYVMRMRG